MRGWRGTPRSLWGLVSPGAAGTRAPPRSGAGARTRGGRWGHTGTGLSLAPPRRPRGPRLPVQAINPSVSRGSVCHLRMAGTAGCPQPRESPARRPRDPRDAGTLLGAVGSGTEIPSGMNPSITDPVRAREGEKFGHRFPSSNIISFYFFFFNIKARCCWKKCSPFPCFSIK